MINYSAIFEEIFSLTHQGLDPSNSIEYRDALISINNGDATVLDYIIEWCIELFEFV